MMNARAYMLVLSGTFFILGAMYFTGFAAKGSETLMFWLVSLTGFVLLIVGLLMRRPLDSDPKEVRQVAYIVMAGGVIIFLASALLERVAQPWWILVTCGAYAATMYVLSTRLTGSIDG